MLFFLVAFNQDRQNYFETIASPVQLLGKDQIQELRLSSDSIIKEVLGGCSYFHVFCLQLGTANSLHIHYAVNEHPTVV